MVCASATLRSRSLYGAMPVATSHALTPNAYASAEKPGTRRIKTSGGMYGSVPTMCCFWKPPLGLPPVDWGFERFELGPPSSFPPPPSVAIRRPATVLPSASSSEYTAFCSEFRSASSDSAKPKSHSVAFHRASSSTLEGLTSRCTYPRACTNASALAT